MIRRALLPLLLLAVSTALAEGELLGEATVPRDDLLTYRITWLGLHCGDMTLESHPVEGKPALAQMEMRVRTTELFDSIYRVRSIISSVYDQRRASTRRYHEQSREQDRLKDDLWVVRPDDGSARRVKNGEVERFEIPGGGVLDPLAMLYRIRALAPEPGQRLSLTVMTTKGALEASVVGSRWEQIETSGRPVPALKVVQEAVGDDEFGRGGAMTLWLSADERRVPYRIEFDLSFGSLVATLYPQGSAPALDVEVSPVE